MADIFLTDKALSDLNPLLFGREVCKSGKHFGPSIRKYTLIHYVEAGAGIFVKGGKTYEVKKGQAFIILPDEVTYYEADKENPWVYRWIGFNGILSREFERLSPVIDIESRYFPYVPEEERDTYGIEYILAGKLFSLFAYLFGDGKDTNRHVRVVKDYIKSSYMENISVEKIASSLSLNRRYLSRIFKENTGFSIKEYLLHVRMEEARRLLSDGKGVFEAATLSGYNDASNFSKMYKRTFGISPIEERKK